MANIVLKDKNGANIVYKNVDYVSFQTLEGGTVRFNERAADIISVTDLPTEDINDNAIYRLTTKDDNGNTTVKFYAHENSGDWIEVAEGAKMSDLVVTENGEYTPVEAEDGFAKVTVNIDTFTDVEEFPTENIDQEAIYRVVRQDEETGATYTTYGIFDADDTKTVLEYNAEEGWVECGAGGAVANPIEITANGVYDETTLHDYVGDIEPGARYVYKHKIDKAVLAELFTYAGENGALHQFTIEDVPVVTSIYKIGNEYMLANNMLAVAEGTPAGQFYCTGAITHFGASFAKGWNIVGAKMSDTMDLSIPLAVEADMRIPMLMPSVFDNTTIFGVDGLLDFYRDNLLQKKVDMDNRFVVTKLSETAAGKLRGSDVYEIEPGLTIDQFKEIPTFVAEASNTNAQVYMLETAYQFLLLTEQGGKSFMTMQGVPAETMDNYHMVVETDAYFMFQALLMVFVYVKDLSAAGAEDLEGTFEEGHWYFGGMDMGNEMSLATYHKTTYEAYNPIVVNIPNADTIVEVKELPTSGVESDKIYKKVVSKDTDATIYVCDAEKGLVTLSGYGLPYNYNCYVVDSAPVSIPAPDIGTLTINIALVLDTGEAYTNLNGDDVTDIRNQSMFLKNLTYGGYSTDTSSMTEVGCYYFLLDTMTNYGVLADPDKKIYEYNENGWEESGAGYRLMVDVAELPTENIVDNKVYCIRNIIEAKTGVYIMQSSGSGFYFDVLMNALISAEGGTCVTEHYIVDELPSNPTPSALDREAMVMSTHIYILNGSEDAPVVSTDGSTYITFGEYFTSLDLFDPGEYKGLVSNDTDVTETGYYTVIRDASESYTYGIPNDGNNKSIMVYRNGTWVRFVEETPVAEPEEPTDPEATT